jgi:signal transduction histidine kinase
MLASHPRVDALAESAASRLTNPARAALIRELVRAATVERKSRGGRVAFKDGRHFEFAAVPLPDGNALFTMLDITDSRRVERVLRERAEALVAADKVKTAFVANMSYELRTPLTSIGGFAEMLDKGYAGKLTKPSQDYVKAILDSVGSLGTMIDEVLRTTQDAAGLVGVDRETVDLLQILDSVAAEHDVTASDKKQEFVTDFEAGVGRVEGDAKRLRSAIATLLDAAITTTQPEGRILLHASGTPTGAMIVVSDNGPGTTEVDMGEVREVVEAHGGTFTRLAEAGQGTMIKIELPR